MSMFHQTWTLFRKDLLRELRSKEITTTTLAFAVLLIIVFTFAFYDRNQVTSSGQVFPGILWVSLLFSGTLALGRTFQDEKDSGCLRALAMIPGTTVSLFASKFTLNLLLLVFFECLLLPLLGLAFNVPWATILSPELLASLGMGTVGFAALGTLLSAMLVHHKMREVMLPLLLYPLLIPLVIAGVKSTTLLYHGEEYENAISWLRAMAVMDVMFVVGAQLMFRWVHDAIE